MKDGLEERKRKHREKMRRWRKNNREKQKQYNKEYRAKNLAKMQAIILCRSEEDVFVACMFLGIYNY